MNQTFTLTFGDRAENNKGMQIIGTQADEGFTYDDLKHVNKQLEEMGVKSTIIHLNEYLPNDIGGQDAFLLVARGFCDAISSADGLYDEQQALKKDTKALMRGVVKNKNARHNLCFDDKSQEPDYVNGKGRIIAYEDVPLLSKLREDIGKIVGPKAVNLCVEGNYYYDPNKCYIGAHGDGERRKVVGVRLGKVFPLHFQWYQRSEKIGKRLQINLNHGDMYMMSEKAVGTDWLQKIIPTLRHSAGLPRVLKLDDNYVLYH